jgi:hypothetical protein
MQSRAKTKNPPLRVLSTKYPGDRAALLEAVAQRRGEVLSRTIAHALDRLIEEHFPGSIGEAA